MDFQKVNSTYGLPKQRYQVSQQLATTFIIGDQVRIEPDSRHDNKPHNGIVVKACKVQGIDEYALDFPDGYGGKHAWYQNCELELVHRPEYK